MASGKKVLILQTSDEVRYKPMIDATEELHRAYAARYDYDYARFTGIKRGTQSWNACFNRIFILQDLLTEGKYDWVLYMDADTVIVDLDQKLDEFLHEDHALVVCRGASDDPAVNWDINNGVAFYNMRHAHTPQIIFLWSKLLESFIVGGGLEQEPTAAYQDQDMLAGVLQHKFPSSAKVYRGDEHNKFNYDGPFIKQILRNHGKDLAERTVYLKALAKGIRKRFGLAEPLPIPIPKSNAPQHNSRLL